MSFLVLVLLLLWNAQTTVHPDNVQFELLKAAKPQPKGGLTISSSCLLLLAPAAAPTLRVAPSEDDDENEYEGRGRAEPHARKS